MSQNSSASKLKNDAKIITGLSTYKLFFTNLRVLIVALFFIFGALYAHYSGAQIYLTSLIYALAIYSPLYIYFAVKTIKNTGYLEGKKFELTDIPTASLAASNKVAKFETNLSRDTAIFNKAFFSSFLNLYKYLLPFLGIYLSLLLLQSAYSNYLFELGNINYTLSIVLNSIIYVLVAMIIMPVAVFAFVRKVSGKMASLRRYFNYLLLNAIGQTLFYVITFLLLLLILFLAVTVSASYKLFFSILILPMIAMLAGIFFQIVLINTFYQHLEQEITREENIGENRAEGKI